MVDFFNHRKKEKRKNLWAPPPLHSLKQLETGMTLKLFVSFSFSLSGGAGDGGGEGDRVSSARSSRHNRRRPDSRSRMWTSPTRKPVFRPYFAFKIWRWFRSWSHFPDCVIRVLVDNSLRLGLTYFIKILTYISVSFFFGYYLFYNFEIYFRTWACWVRVAGEGRGPGQRVEPRDVQS